MRLRRLDPFRTGMIVFLVCAIIAVGFGIWREVRSDRSSDRGMSTATRGPLGTRQSTTVMEPANTPVPRGTLQATSVPIPTSEPMPLPMCSPTSSATPVARGDVQGEFGILDQSQRAAVNWTAGHTIGLDQAVGQVFTAGASGPLTAVWLGLWSAASGSPAIAFPDAVVELRSVDPATGLLTETSLARVQIPNATIPASGEIGVVVTFDAPALVEAGRCYLVVVQSAEPRQPHACCNWSYQPALGAETHGDAYPNGTLVIRYADQPFYYPIDLSDMAFETYLQRE